MPVYTNILDSLRKRKVFQYPNTVVCGLQGLCGLQWCVGYRGFNSSFIVDSAIRLFRAEKVLTYITPSENFLDPQGSMTYTSSRTLSV